MATQGYQEYQGGYHSMPNHGFPPNGHYEHWNHQHSFPPPNDHIPYHVSTNTFHSRWLEFSVIEIEENIDSFDFQLSKLKPLIVFRLKLS